MPRIALKDLPSDAWSHRPRFRDSPGLVGCQKQLKLREVG